MPEVILDQIASKERQFTPKIVGPLKGVDHETRITSSLYNFLNNGEERKQQVADNLSIKIDATEEEFRDAFDRKQEAILEFYEVANENLGSAKEEILRFVGERLGAEHRVLIESRLDDVQEVAVADAIVEGGGLPRINGLAHFDHPSGEFVLSFDKNVESQGVLGIGIREMINRNILHELLHVASDFGSIQLKSGLFENIKSGIGATVGDINKPNFMMRHGNQLDEGAQEYIRYKYLDGTSPAYERQVMFWELAIKIDPSIEQKMLKAKFLGEGRGDLIGSLELIFGPTSIEEFDEHTSETPNRARNMPLATDMLLHNFETMRTSTGIGVDLDIPTLRREIEAFRIAMLQERGLGQSDEELKNLRESSMHEE